MPDITRFSYKCPICQDNTWVLSRTQKIDTSEYDLYKRCPAWNFVEKACNYKDYKEKVGKAG